MHLNPHLPSILKLLSANEIISLYAPVNLKKTIELPLEIVKNEARCYVVIASKSITISLAEHQSKMENAIVGYAIDDEENTVTEDTQIAYVTADYMWKKMLGYQGAIDFTDIIILDELYPGDFDYEMIISIWKIAHDLGVPRLIISHSLPIIFTNLTVKEYIIKPPDFIGRYQYQETNNISNIINSLSKTQGDILIITNSKKEKDTIIDATPIKISELNYGVNNKIGQKNILVLTNKEAKNVRLNNITYIISTGTVKRKVNVFSGGFRKVLSIIDKQTLKSYESFFMKNKNNTFYILANENKIPNNYSPIITNQDIYQVILMNMGKYLTFIDKDELNKQTTFVKKSIIFKDEGFQYFFPHFELSVRNSSFLWNWIKGLRFNNKIIQEGKKYGLNLENLEIDVTSEYSSIRPYHIPDIDRIFMEENINPESIIDATANVGGDSINFLRMFPTVKLIALEIDNKIAKVLRRNLANAIQIIDSNVEDYDTKAINMSAIEYFQSNRYADMIFIDAPWGGREYKSFEKIELQLDGIGIGVLIHNIFVKGMTPLIVLKAPNNVDLDIILQDINLKVDYEIYDVAGNYKLIIIRYQGKKIVDIANEPEEVLLTYSTYPIFPGIVTSCLIDNFPYFNNKPKFLGHNDLETCLNMWSDLMKTIGSLDGSDDDILQWCRTNNVIYNRIVELILLVKSTIRSLMKLGFAEEIVERTFTTAGVMNAARPILVKVYQDQTMIHKNDFFYINPITKETYRLDNKNIISNIHQNPPIGVIVFATTEVKTAKGSIKLITFAIETDKDGLGRPIVTEKKIKEERVKETRVIERKRGQIKEERKENEENPFDILDSLQIPRIGSSVKIDLNSVEQQKIKDKITKEDLINFYGKLKGANKWSSKTIKTNKYDWLKKYFNPETDIYLDIGTGSGEDFAIISKITHAKLGIPSDIVDNRVEKDDKLEIITENVELDLEDNSIDLITIFHALHHSKDAMFRLNDVVRILKKGGLLIIKDHDVTSAEDANNVSFEHFIYSIGEGSAKITDASKYNEIEPMYYYPAFYIRNYLKNLGLQEIHFEAYPGPTKVYFAIFKK